MPKITKPITPEMRAIMETLADKVISARTASIRANDAMNNYVAQCQVLLGVDAFTAPGVSIVFDPDTASFNIDIPEVKAQ